MKHEHGNELLVIVGILCSLIAACASAPPKMSRWSSPTEMSYERVYNAAIAAATTNQFTVVSQDRASGIMSLKKDQYVLGDKVAERTMSVRVKQVADKIEVSTNVSGGSLGLGTLESAVYNELTTNFYTYLFRELDITDPAARNVVIEDLH